MSIESFSILISPNRLFPYQVELAHLFAAEEAILVGDLVVILFLMHERSKKESSFWAPFINTLPHPSSATQVFLVGTKQNCPCVSHRDSLLV